MHRALVAHHRKSGTCRPELDCTRRWTGIEPAGRGSPVPAALKAVEPTRRSDTSAADPSGDGPDEGACYRGAMNKVVKLLLVLAVIGLAVVAVQKVRSSG